ncbi:unnamed protein product, partial [Nesidiocoris tenuis]
MLRSVEGRRSLEPAAWCRRAASARKLPHRPPAQEEMTLLAVRALTPLTPKSQRPPITPTPPGFLRRLGSKTWRSSTSSRSLDVFKPPISKSTVSPVNLRSDDIVKKDFDTFRSVNGRSTIFHKTDKYKKII